MINRFMLGYVLESMAVEDFTIRNFGIDVEVGERFYLMQSPTTKEIIIYRQQSTETDKDNIFHLTLVRKTNELLNNEFIDEELNLYPLHIIQGRDFTKKIDDYHLSNIRQIFDNVVNIEKV